jgi:non-ribosomal peptide synthase protein (TIGR01720 family)
VDHVGGLNTVASARTFSVSQSAEETRALLQDVPETYHTQINDVLLAAVVQAFSSWTGGSSLTIDLEGHGREELFEEVDLSRSVGWFTSIFPVQLSIETALDPGEVLKSVKEQLRAIPNRGIGYGLLRYLGTDEEIRARLRCLRKAEVSFNYLGQFDQVFADSALLAPARESSGPPRSPRGMRGHLLEIVGSVVMGQLHMTWTYSENIHRRATVEKLAQEFITALRSLITHCQLPGAGGYTPSDFPHARLNEHALRMLARVLGQREASKESSA